MGTARVSAPFGSLSADSESPDYAVACRARAQSCLRSREKDVEGLESWVAHLRTNDRFRKLDDEFGHPFRDWKHFCVTKQPHGLGYDPDAIEALIHERKTAQQIAADPTIAPELGHGGPRPGAGRKPRSVSLTQNDALELEAACENRNQVEHINLIPVGGTGASYLVRRLKRDAPEVAAELARGELPSARAAAIKAGIVKVPTRVAQAFRLVERMSPAERLDFERQIQPLLEQAKGTE